MNVLASLAGLAAGVLVWFLLSTFIAIGVTRIEAWRPALAGSRIIKLGEITACALLVLFSLAVAIWVAFLLWVTK